MIKNFSEGQWKVGGSSKLPIANDEQWDGPSAQNQIFSLAGFDTDNPKVEIARQGFLVYDASNPTLKGSYKLPFAIVRDGRLYASTAGLRAAAQRLPQTDIPTSVMESAQRILDMYKSKSDSAAKYANIDFSPPEGVTSAAKRGLELHEKGLSGSGLESATVLWARKYASGESVSPARARMGNRFFGRNARFANAPKDSPAWVSWLLWGGSAGKAWFSKLVAQMDAADKKTSATVHGFIKVAELNKQNPFLKEVELILTDFEPNSNREGIPRSEAQNIIKTALYTPIKIAISETDYAGHKNAVPIGPITSVYEDTHDGKPVIKAKAIIWTDEYSDVYDILKAQSSEREYIGTSWEIYYESATAENGVNWLNNVIFAGTCIVDVPAYGDRTKLLSKVAEKQMNELNDQIEQLQTQLTERENELNELRKEVDAYKAEAHAKAQAEKRQNVVARLLKAGFTQAEADEKIEFYVSLDDAVFDKIVTDFVRTRTEASKNLNHDTVIPEVGGSHTPLSPKQLAQEFKKLKAK
jgi:hypothetical protein